MIDAHLAPFAAAERMRRLEDARTRHLEYRLRILPSQIESARAKVERLEREARSLGLSHLLGEAA